MPNLDAEAVTEWLAERDAGAALVWPQPPVPLPEGTATLLRELGAVLDAAQANDPAGLSQRLMEDPLRERMQALLAQLDTPTRFRLLAWLGERSMPRRDLVVRACLAGSTPEGRLLSEELWQACRSALLARIFDRDRVALLLGLSRQAGQAEEAA